MTPLLGGKGDDTLFGDAFFDDPGAFDVCNGQQGFDLSATCEVNNQMEGDLPPKARHPLAARGRRFLPPPRKSALTQSCHLLLRRPHLPWPVRARCRSTWRQGWLSPPCQGGTWRHTPAAGGACGGLANRCARDSYPTCEPLPRSASSSGACRPLDGVKLCAQRGLSLRGSHDRSTPRPRSSQRPPRQTGQQSPGHAGGNGEPGLDGVGPMSFRIDRLRFPPFAPMCSYFYPPGAELKSQYNETEEPARPQPAPPPTPRPFPSNRILADDRPPRA